MTTPKPAGAEYVCVPREPTTKMFAALIGSWNKNDGAQLVAAQWALGTFREDYQAMLAASPRPVPDAGVIERAARAVADAMTFTPWDDQAWNMIWSDEGRRYAYKSYAEAALSVVCIAPPNPAGSGIEQKIKDSLQALSRQQDFLFLSDWRIEKIAAHVAGLIKGADSGDAGKLRETAQNVVSSFDAYGPVSGAPIEQLREALALPASDVQSQDVAGMREACAKWHDDQAAACRHNAQGILDHFMGDDCSDEDRAANRKDRFELLAKASFHENSAKGIRALPSDSKTPGVDREAARRAAWAALVGADIADTCMKAHVIRADIDRVTDRILALFHPAGEIGK